jgi:hypothetical protein
MFFIQGKNSKSHKKAGSNGMYELIRAGILHALLVQVT